MKKILTSQRYTLERHKCREYLDHIVGEHITRPKLKLNASMREVHVKDIDVFHKLVGVCRRKEELCKRADEEFYFPKDKYGLYFSVRIPNDSYWTVMLERDENHAFSEKYGKYYTSRVVSLLDSH